MKEQHRPDYTAYEYKEVTVQSEKASLYLDGYESFGWVADENFPPKESGGKVTLRLKRDRKQLNRTELTRLQRQFEAGLEELAALERSKTSTATIWAMVIGLLGTAFMAGSVFAITAKTPLLWLSILLALPAFAGWIAPYFIYKKLKENRTRQVTPYLEEKMEEIYGVCEKGHSLL